MESETFADVLNEARDQRPITVIHERIDYDDVSYQSVYAWFSGATVPKLKHIEPLFSALGMTNAQRARAIKAAKA